MGCNKPQVCPHGVLGIRRCKECRRAYEKSYRQSDKERGRRKTAKWAEKNRQHKRLYARKKAGIPVDHGESPIGECPLCSEVDTLVPDHDHRTGKLRGWICGRCNRALGTYEAYLPMHSKFEAYLNA